MAANGWSNMVEEELLPPTAGDDHQAVRVCKCKRRTSGKLVMKTLRARGRQRLAR